MSGISSTPGGPGPGLPVGPDLAILFMVGFISLIVPIFSIVVTFDAVSKERVQGTLDLLLSRPVSRSGVLLGKFLGAFVAVAFPVSVVIPAGLAAISLHTGQAPSAPFAVTFYAMTLLIVAYYVLLQIIFSTIAKTSGTAVLYGVLLWLLFNVLYGIITLVIGLTFFPDAAAQAEFNRLSTLGNPGGIASNVMFGAAPATIGQFLSGSLLDPWQAGIGATVWFVLLFALALWTFERKAAE